MQNGAVVWYSRVDRRRYPVDSIRAEETEVPAKFSRIRENDLFGPTQRHDRTYARYDIVEDTNHNDVSLLDTMATIRLDRVSEVFAFAGFPPLALSRSRSIGYDRSISSFDMMMLSFDVRRTFVSFRQSSFLEIVYVCVVSSLRSIVL